MPSEQQFPTFAGWVIEAVMRRSCAKLEGHTNRNLGIDAGTGNDSC